MKNIRSSIRATAIGAAVAMTFAVPFAITASAQDMPKRKSGLWEISMTSSAAPAATKSAGGIKMTQCVDQSRDDAFRQLGHQMERESKCTRTNMQRGPGSMSFESTCDFAGTKMMSKSKITGDFDSAYRMEMTTRYDPPLMGKAEGSMVVEAKWLGACKPGQRPGDMTMPNGTTMNAYDMLDSKKK